jgi:hypothetical protein
MEAMSGRLWLRPSEASKQSASRRRVFDLPSLTGPSNEAPVACRLTQAHASRSDHPAHAPLIL